MIGRYFDIIGVQLRNNFSREALYRGNFATMVIVDVVWMAIELSLFAVIYANVDTLAGWTREQVYFFLGLFFATDAVFTTFFQRNFWQFNALVNKGELDILLTKPANPIFLTLTRYFNLTAWLNVVLGIGIMARYADRAGFEGGWLWALVPMWMLIGLCAQGLLRFAFCIWVFWTERSWAITSLYFQFFALATKPDALYPLAVRYVILTVLPFGFIASVPARALLQGLHPREYVMIFAVLAGFLVFNTVMWRKGLRRYQSASS